MLNVAYAWMFFITWLNIFLGIMLLNTNEPNYFICGMAALNFLVAALCYPALLVRNDK